MITLYVKTHKVTGLKYLGKTERDLGNLAKHLRKKENESTI